MNDLEDLIKDLQLSGGIAARAKSDAIAQGKAMESTGSAVPYKAGPALRQALSGRTFTQPTTDTASVIANAMAQSMADEVVDKLAGH
jgi:uncharacterized membrane protein